LQGWQSHRLYLALDTTMLWERYCMIHLSVVCCGRAVPLLWRVLKHGSAKVAFGESEGLLRQARWLWRHHPDVMLLADRGLANHDMMAWLRSSRWHYCLRLPCDLQQISSKRSTPWSQRIRAHRLPLYFIKLKSAVLLHGPRRYPTTVGSMYIV